nr:MAG TPA: Polymer-forming cytoskeletal [Bacteriophage sp.]
MKKFVLWMIRVFELNIPTEKIVTKVVEKQVLIPDNGVIEGDLLVKGHVTVKGSLDVEGNLVVYKDATCKLNSKEE